MILSRFTRLSMLFIAASVSTASFANHLPSIDVTFYDKDSLCGGASVSLNYALTIQSPQQSTASDPGTLPPLSSGNSEEISSFRGVDDTYEYTGLSISSSDYNFCGIRLTPYGSCANNLTKDFKKGVYYHHVVVIPQKISGPFNDHIQLNCEVEQ